MDFLQARRRREWILISLVALAAVLANLPQGLMRGLHVNTTYLVAALGLLVLLALFLYVRFTFFLLYALLVVGANLPDQWADGLGISKMPLLMALGFMVAGSLVNHVTRLVPSGLEPKPKSRSQEGTKALSSAVERNNLSLAKRVLDMDIDPDQPDEEGLPPLLRAARNGRLELVQLLLQYGAEPTVTAGDGCTALMVAEQHGHGGVAEALRSAVQARQAAIAPPMNADSGFIKT